MPKRRRSPAGDGPPRQPVEWLGSVRRLPMPERAPGGGHPPWIIIWYAPRHGILQIAAIPRAGRLAAVRDALLAGIRRSGTAGAPLVLQVDAAQLHRDACELFPEATAFVSRDPALEYALRSPPALAVLADLARAHLRAQLSVVDGGLSSTTTLSSPPPAAGRSPTASRDVREETFSQPRDNDGDSVPRSGERVLRLVTEPTPTPAPPRLVDASPSVEDDARTVRELVDVLTIDRRTLATAEHALESVALANLSLVAAFLAWDEGHVHEHDHEDAGERPLDLLLELLATHRCATVATMDADDLEQVLFEALPSEADFSPDQAIEIIGELQRFTRFLEREAALRLPPAARALLNGAATKRLEAVLSR